MFKNHFKTAWRNLPKDRQSTFLNIAGLSIGLVCALLIWLWVRDELSMNKNINHDVHLYQVMQNIREDDGIDTTGHTTGLLANAIEAGTPEVQYTAGVIPASSLPGNGIISSGNTLIKAGGYIAGCNDIPGKLSLERQCG